SRSADTRPGNGTKPIAASMVTLLPDPDSPTTPRICPSSSSNPTSSTAWSMPLAVGNRTLKLRISSSAMTSLLESGIERIAQSIAEQIAGQHRHEDHEPGQRDDPPGAQHEFARVAEHG